MSPTNSIPKIIHYCWFGKKPKSKSMSSLIESWKELLPDYKIIEWNEDNFDIESSCEYVKKAYAEGKWAFVSDYVRIYALNKMGGIYLDTDVELVKGFDNYLNDEMFVANESDNSICTAVIGSKSENPILLDFLKIYDAEKFNFSNDIMPNSVRLKNFLEDRFNIKIEFDNEYKLDGVSIYSRSVFGAKDIHTYKEYVTKETVAIHRLDASWYSNKKKFLRFCKKIVRKVINGISK